MRHHSPPISTLYHHTETILNYYQLISTTCSFASILRGTKTFPWQSSRWGRRRVSSLPRVQHSHQVSLAAHRAIYMALSFGPVTPDACATVERYRSPFHYPRRMVSGRKKGQVAKGALLDRLANVTGIRGRRALEKRNVEELLGACLHFGVADDLTDEEVRVCCLPSVLQQIRDVISYYVVGTYFHQRWYPTLHSHTNDSRVVCIFGAAGFQEARVKGIHSYSHVRI